MGGIPSRLSSTEKSKYLAQFQPAYGWITFQRTFGRGSSPQYKHALRYRLQTGLDYNKTMTGTVYVLKTGRK